MEDFNKTTKNIVLILCAHFFVLSILGYFFRNSSFLVSAFKEVTFKQYCLGLLFGILFSVVKLFLLRHSIKSSVKKSKNKATFSAFGQYLFRFFLTGLVLYISIVNDNLDFFATTLGVLSLQSSSYIAGLIIKRNPDAKNIIMEAEKELDL